MIENLIKRIERLEAFVRTQESMENVDAESPLSLGIQNPILAMLGANNDSIYINGAPRLAWINLALSYNGSTNTMEITGVEIYGGALTTQDVRYLSVLAAHSSIASASDAQQQAYAAKAFASGGTYQSLSVSSSDFVGSGYSHTLEVRGNSDGTIDVRVTRTGGSTVAGDVHVSLIIAV